jgi:hypothetical protein
VCVCCCGWGGASAFGQPDRLLVVCRQFRWSLADGLARARAHAPPFSARREHRARHAHADPQAARRTCESERSSCMAPTARATDGVVLLFQEMRPRGPEAREHEGRQDDRTLEWGGERLAGGVAKRAKKDLQGERRNESARVHRSKKAAAKCPPQPPSPRRLIHHDSDTTTPLQGQSRSLAPAQNKHWLSEEPQGGGLFWRRRPRPSARARRNGRRKTKSPQERLRLAPRGKGGGGGGQGAAAEMSRLGIGGNGRRARARAKPPPRACRPSLLSCARRPRTRKTAAGVGGKGEEGRGSARDGAGGGGECGTRAWCAFLIGGWGWREAFGGGGGMNGGRATGRRASRVSTAAAPPPRPQHRLRAGGWGRRGERKGRGYRVLLHHLLFGRHRHRE